MAFKMHILVRISTRPVRKKWRRRMERDKKGKARRTERKEKSGRQERQCYSSRKFLELMVHNKRLSVPKLIMSVHAGLISFPAFNKYVAMVIRHNFSTRRDLVREHRHVYTRECANTVRVNLTRESTRKRREREKDGGEIAHAMYYVDIR